MKYNIHQLPSPGYLTYQLTKEEMNFVWERIAKASDPSKNPKLYNDRLAGNISKSYDMGIYDLDIMNNIVFRLAHEYEKQFPVAKGYEEQVSGDAKASNHMALSDWWVNYQYQTEFNPIHSHSGIYSWVIWMKIPTEFEDQAKLPISTNSNAKNQISNFEFTYINSLGAVFNHYIEMNKAKEGLMCFFPARLKHSVYPFFNCAEARITVAGNISLYSNQQNDK